MLLPALPDVCHSNTCAGTSSRPAGAASRRATTKGPTEAEKNPFSSRLAAGESVLLWSGGWE